MIMSNLILLDFKKLTASLYPRKHMALRTSGSGGKKALEAR